MTSENVQAAQLIAEGPQDIWLTGDPQASFFRSMYRRHVSYGMSVEKFNFNGDTVRFDRRGDLLGACYLTASDPVTNVQLSTFPISGIARVDLFIGGQLVDSQDTTFSSQVWPVTEATTWSERNVPSSFYPLHFFFCKDWSRAFPLVALEYHDIEIKIRDASSSYTFTLWAHMIHLSDPERAWYKRQPHKFLITQTQTARIDLQRDWGRFGGPIKYMAWPAKIVPLPDIVTGFVASNPTETTVDLAWDPALYASLYSIVSEPPTTTQTTSGTSLTFSGLDPDTEYTFTITPSNTSGNGPSTTSDPITTLSPPPPPNALPYLFAYGATVSTVDLSWRPNPNTDLYSIESSPPSTTQTTNDSQMTFTGLTPDQEYTFTITPSNASGNGPSTTSNPITTLPSPPEAVTGFVASNPTSTTVDLVWDPALYATEYSIVSDPPTTTETTSGTTLTFTGLTPDQEYTFTITPSNVSGNGPSTTSDPITTLPPPPEAVTGFVASNPTSTTVDLAWDSALYATSYSIVSSPVTTATIVPGYTYVPFSSVPASFTLTSNGRSWYNNDGILFDGPDYGGIILNISSTNPPDIYAGVNPGSWYTLTDGLGGYTRHAGYDMYLSGYEGDNFDFAWALYLKDGTTDQVIIHNPYPADGIGFWVKNLDGRIRINTQDPNDAQIFTISIPLAVNIQTTSGTSLTFPGLDPNTEYTFTITPSNTSGNGPSTTSDPITTLPSPPEAVTGFVASNPTETTVDLAWDPSLDASLYSIVSDPPTTTQTTSGTTLTFTGLTPDQEYTFTITPSNASGNGPSTTSDPITTLPPPPPPEAVTGFVASNPTYTTVDLAWDPSLDASLYSIVSDPPTTTQTTSGTTLTFTGLTPDQEYTFTITPSNASGNGPSTTSDPISTLPLPPLPNTVTGFVASNPTETTVDLVWDPALYATDYSIVSFPVSDTYTTSDTFVTFTGLTQDTEYTFTITPSNITGNGPPTTSDPISTLLPLPGFAPVIDNTPVSVTTTTIELTWSTEPPYPPSYATSYNVYCYDTTSTLLYVQSCSLTPPYTFTGLQTNYAYYFRLSSVNARGEQEYASSTSVIMFTVPTVTGVSVGNPTETTVDITWDAVTTDLSPYDFTYIITSNPESTTTTQSYSGPTPSYTFYGLTPDTEYTFTVTPLVGPSNLAGDPVTSDPISTLLPLPGPGPAMYNPFVVTTTTIELEWVEYVPEYATSFNVYAYSDSGPVGFVNVPISSFSYTYTGLQPDTYYHFAVAGVNATGAGQAGAPSQDTRTAAV